jgi:hypothetical protein
MFTKMNTFATNLRLFGVLILALFSICTHAESHVKRVTVDLYGHNYTFNFNNADFVSAYNNLMLANYSQESIAEVCTQLHTSVALKSIIEKMDDIASAHKMDDMAYLLLSKKFIHKAFTHISSDFLSIILHAILSSKNKDVVLAFNKQSIMLYGRTNMWIANVLYVQIGNKYYFDLSFNQKSNPTNDQELLAVQQNNKPLPIIINHMEPPLFDAKFTKTSFPFEYEGNIYFFNTKLNQSLIEYYRELPPIEIGSMYLNYGLSNVVKNSLVKEMKQAIAQLPDYQALDFLLSFTQKAFNYQDDMDRYGEEKFSMPEETLLNYYSDCEDRAMLFATLVKEVLGLHSVALYYKSARHINIGVESTHTVHKGNFTFNEQQYIICEPTYTGFRVGQNHNKAHMATLIDW